MPKYHSASKILFYHLPTWGRAGIKLGDAWYVSNVSIIFDCSMLLYLLFWTIMGFIFHFYIIFGTNLLTGGPAQNCCFCAYFSVSKKRNIKRSPNGMKPSGTWFSERTWSRGLGPYVKKSSRKPRGRGARLPPWAHPPASWPPHGVPDFNSKSSGLHLFQERSSRRFHSVWCSFSANTKMGKK